MGDQTFFVPMADSEEKITTSTSVSTSGSAPAKTVVVLLSSISGSHHFRMDGTDPDTDNCYVPEGGQIYFGASKGQTVKVRTASGAGEFHVSWQRST